MERLPINPLKLIGLVILAIIGLTIFFGSWYTVDEGERGVLLRTGKVVGSMAPGIHFKTPWIEDVVRFEVRTRKIGPFETSGYSKDIQNAKYTMSINYHLDPASVENLYKTIGTDYASRTLEPNILRIMKEAAGKFVASEIVNQRDRLGDEITTALANEMRPMGIVVEQVQLENVDFDESFEQAIAARMRAEVEVQQQRQVLEKEKVQAETIKVNAEANAYKTRQEAEANAFAVKQQADADSYAIKVTKKAEADGITQRGEALRQNQNLVELVKAERWDGVLPTTMLPNGATPMLNLAAK